MKNKIICIFLVLILVASSMEIFAATKTELKNQENNIDSKISDTKDEISEISSNLSSAMKEVQNLIAQITEYEQGISDLNTKIKDAENQITEKEKEIEKTQKDLEEQQDLLDKRLVALYESGNTSYIELLLSSADLTDFISKYYLISELATYDTELIGKIRQSKIDLENAKVEIEKTKEGLETSKADLVNKQEVLNNTKKEKDNKVAGLTAEEKKLKSELENFEKEKKAIQDELEAMAKADAANSNGNNSGVTSPSKAGYIFPVQGCSKANINKLVFPSYPGHNGIDVNINVVGKNVLAVKDGTVYTSKAYIKNGSYYSYGEYIVINHYDGTMTGYAHMQAGSRTVKVGDKVKQGQVIGKVGSTGNSTGPHLHFEVRINNGKTTINPIPYLP